jgi:hypothetical protein
MTSDVRLERRNTDLHVTAAWVGSGGTEMNGPQRVVIEAGEVTAETLRLTARHVSDMTAEFHEMPAVGGYRTMVRRYVEDRLAELPGSGDAFHRSLLDLYTDVTERSDGRVGVLSVFADAMRVPVETMQACLQVARRPGLLTTDRGSDG